MPDIDKLIAFEDGELEPDETVELFQGLIDTGVVWHLQGSYGRTAAALIAAGLCVRPEAAQAHGR